MKLRNVIALAAAGCVCCGAAFAQECTDADKAALEACVTQAEATCNAAVPQCQRLPVSLDELNAAIDQKCGDCSETSTSLPKNYGKYRSCAVSVLNTLKAFSLIDVPTKQAVLAKTKACRAIIKAKRGNKGNHGKPE